MNNDIKIKNRYYFIITWVILFSFSNSFNKTTNAHTKKEVTNLFSYHNNYTYYFSNLSDSLEIKKDTIKVFSESATNIKPKAIKNNSSSDKRNLAWGQISGAIKYQIIVEAINESAIFGKTYDKIINEEVVSENYFVSDSLLKSISEFRWKVRAKTNGEWTRYSNYNIESVQEQENKEEIINEIVDEIYFNLKYLGLLNEIIVAKFKNDKVYLPILEILAMLQINHKVEFEKKIISGILDNDLKDIYEINFKKLLFAKSNYISKINTDEFIKTDLEYYLTPEKINLFFDLNLKVDFRRLKIKVRSIKTPLYERVINQKELSVYQNLGLEKTYPLLYGRNRNLFKGLFTNYNLNATYIKNQSPIYSYQLGVGAEILGGDFQLFNRQSFLKSKIQFSQTDVRWRYAFINNSYISNIILGNSRATGLNQYEFNGVQISNVPLEDRKIYGNYNVEENTKPNWTVEIYKDNRLIKIVKANSDGDFYFQIPLEYGVVLIEFHKFGTNGEYEIQRKMYQVPYSQIPKGRIDYTLSFGRLIGNQENIFQSSASYGISNWLTTTIGSDIFIDNVKQSSVYNITSARIFENSILDVKIAPNTLLSANLNSIFPNLSNVNLGATFYDENAKLNPTKITKEFTGNIFFPLRFTNASLSFIARGRKTFYNNSERLDISFRSFLNYKRFTPSVEIKHFEFASGNRKIKSDYLNLRLSYSFLLSTNYLTGNLISSRFGYNLSNRNLEYLSFSMSTTFLRKFRINITHTTNFINSFSNTQFRVAYNLPFMRSNTTISGSTFTQSIDGSINFIQNLNAFEFHNRGMIGKSAVAFNAYLDENNNNKFDDFEIRIPDVDVRLSSSGSKQTNKFGSILVHDLNSYSKINASLFGGVNNNPEWKPLNDKFSFISDPNHYKVIDIPFYEASEISGTVNRNINGIKIPVEGITILAENILNKSIKKIKTISDGSFYYYGLQAGQYDIYLDKNDLEKLKVISIPNILETQIKPISADIENEEIEFLLEDKM